MNGSRKITEGALFIALYLLFLLIAFYVPLADMVAIFILPVPIIVYTMRHGWKQSIVLLLGMLIVSSLFATVLSIPITITMGLGGILIGTGIRSEITAYETWARGTIGFVLGIVFTIIFSQWIFQVNFVQEIENVMEQSIVMSQNMMEQFNLQSNSDNAQMVFDQMRKMIDLLPVGIVMAAIVLAFVSQWISYKVINRIGQHALYFPAFRHFQLPKVIIWFYLLAIIVTWFQLEDNSSIYLAAWNVSNLVGLLITIQGFSFVFFYSYTKGLSKAVPIITIVIAFLFPLIGLYLVRILGIIDVGFSLRDRIQPKVK
ncbi:YybS family protein [Aquibacillus sp. 3ASR75-11]|uniref:YybS family protein n=1 Tax=Terrihalobacillus insolitus TaxID=2950438 RepID=A0A9X4AN34_9BACI|nr:YybS family protein [Terrihalobacillus insolitus]MDC3415051.1 YybS family protein [Terrihalobacillus insolitus]MDC3425981.1 YybS family protein [Terrihalobacillus insolitus]